ncbi:MAG: hypothetical protein R2772_07140, partial [Chitinophagales bacterium]
MKKALYLLLSSILLLLVIETISLVLNRSNKIVLPFAINKALIQTKQKTISQVQGYGYLLVDPLLGWGLTESKIKEAGFESSHNTVFLPSNLLCNKPLKILITGGSTSDVVLNPENWPIKFRDLLEEKGICADIYVAAIGGYSSGQELLKTIRDGSEIQPDIHISYSGANEFISPNYISRQENSFYLKAFNSSARSSILPNTLFLIGDVLSTKEKPFLFLEEQNSPAAFWLKNMSIMRALSVEKGYIFIGIVQPILGLDENSQKALVEENEVYVNNNLSFYPIIIQHADTTDYLRNLSNLFTNRNETIFIDDCHLENVYQKEVAEAIENIV